MSSLATAASSPSTERVKSGARTAWRRSMSPLAQAAPYSLIPVRLSSLQNPAVACSRFGAETKVENYIKKNIPTICANWHHNGCLPEHLLGVVAHHCQGGSERNGRVCAWYHEPSHLVELARQLRNLGSGTRGCQNVTTWPLPP